MDQAFEYIIKEGIASEKAYPYEAVDQKCNKKVERTKIITGFTDVPEGDVNQLKLAL